MNPQHTTHDKATEHNWSTLRWLTDSRPLRPHPITLAAYAILAVIAVMYFISTLGNDPTGEPNLSYYGQHDTDLFIDDILHEGDHIVAIVGNQSSETLAGTINCRFAPDESMLGYTIGFASIQPSSARRVDLTAAYLNSHPTLESIESVSGCSVQWPETTGTDTGSGATGAPTVSRSFDRESSDLLSTRLGRLRLD